MKQPVLGPSRRLAQLLAVAPSSSSPDSQQTHCPGAAEQRCAARQALARAAAPGREAAHVLGHQLHQGNVQQHAAADAVKGALDPQRARTVAIVCGCNGDACSDRLGKRGVAIAMLHVCPGQAHVCVLGAVALL